MWTLGGRYLQTLGTFKKWNPLKVDTVPEEDHPYRIPPDTIRLASSTTFKLYMGGKYERRQTKKQEQAEKDSKKVDISKGSVFGKRLVAPILGNYYMPQKTLGRHDFTLDTTFTYIPVYQHLIMPPPSEMPNPETPALLTSPEAKKDEPESSKTSKTSMTSDFSSITKTSDTDSTE